MSKKSIHYLMYGATLIIIIYYVLNFTGILVTSNNPTSANEPNIPLNSISFTSNLIEPKKGDFIAYKFYDNYLGNHVRIHRAVGFEGDTIKITDGVLYVNNINFDENLDLIHYYKTSLDNFQKLDTSIFNYENLYFEKMDSVNCKFLLEDLKAVRVKKLERFVINKEFINPTIQSIYNKPWNKDNFGPIIIPKNKIFVLGDNRDFTLDSRNVGFINENDVEGVLLIIF